MKPSAFRFFYRGGFTLLEVLLSVMILSLVMTLMARYFYTEKKAFIELKKKHLEETPVEDFFIQFKKDISGILIWQEQGFTFKDNRITFHTASEEGMGRIIRVDYVILEIYEGSEKFYSLSRKEYLFPYAMENKEPLAPVSDLVCLQKVKNIEFFFSGICRIIDDNNDDKPRLFEFKDWEFKTMPVAARLRITEAAGLVKELNFWFPEYVFQSFEEIPPLTLKDDQEELVLKQLAELRKTEKEEEGNK